MAGGEVATAEVVVEVAEVRVSEILGEVPWLAALEEATRWGGGGGGEAGGCGGSAGGGG